MKIVKVIVGWGSDGFVSVWMREPLFAGGGNTVEEAITDMKEGIAFHVQVCKEEGYPYPAFLDEPYELELEYDVVSMLQYARSFIKDTKLAEFTKISAAQLGRYANEKTKPRAPQRRKIIEGFHKLASQFNAIPI